MTHHVQLPGTRVNHVATPATLDEALVLMAQPGTRAVAGGTDLLVELDRGSHADVATIVDLSRIDGLDSITEATGTESVGSDLTGQERTVITLGPLVTHNQCVASELLRAKAAPLVQACWEVGSPQLRNRATVAGNIVTASPANDTLSPLIALDATVTLTSLRGSRTMALSKFHRGVRKTAIEPDELMTAISFPAIGANGRGLYLKLGLRRAQAISVVHLAVVCDFAPPGAGVSGSAIEVQRARLALGSVGPTIIRAREAEEALVGRAFDDDAIAAAAEASAAAVNPIDYQRADARYRRSLVAEMVRRALGAVHDGRSVLPQNPALLWGRSDGRWPTGQAYRADHVAATPIQATVNGREVSQPGVGETLLQWLRSTGSTGVKEGCAEGECGSCTVHLDGMAVLSCLVPATRANKATVTTIEGLADTAEPSSAGSALHPLQQAFIDAGAVQCGFCIPGLLMSGAKLLEEHRTPTDEQIKAGLSGNLCRCTGYYKVEDAVRVALRSGERS